MAVHWTKYSSGILFCTANQSKLIELLLVSCLLSLHLPNEPQQHINPTNHDSIVVSYPLCIVNLQKYMFYIIYDNFLQNTLNLMIPMFHANLFNLRSKCEKENCVIIYLGEDSAIILWSTWKGEIYFNIKCLRL